MAIKIGDMVAKRIYSDDGSDSYIIGMVVDIIQMGSGLSNAKGNTYYTVEWSHQHMDQSFLGAFETSAYHSNFEELKRNGVI